MLGLVSTNCCNDLPQYVGTSNHQPIVSISLLSEVRKFDSYMTLQSLKQDLAFWWGSDWQQKASKPSAATAEYLKQLQKDSVVAGECCLWLRLVSGCWFIWPGMTNKLSLRMGDNWSQLDGAPIVRFHNGGEKRRLQWMHGHWNGTSNTYTAHPYGKGICIVICIHMCIVIS